MRVNRARAPNLWKDVFAAAPKRGIVKICENLEAFTLLFSLLICYYESKNNNTGWRQSQARRRKKHGVFMSELVRLSLSIEKPLYDKLESMVRDSGYSNRSEYVRDLIRDKLVDDQWGKSDDVVGTITIVYDHHKRELSEKLTKLQHKKHHNILASTHLHLTEKICAEMIMARGRAGDIRDLSNTLKSQRGVLHAALSMSSTGRGLE
jgi:CopG family nickel-responsive transcriptional regulator